MALEAAPVEPPDTQPAAPVAKQNSGDANPAEDPVDESNSPEPSQEGVPEIQQTRGEFA